MNLDPLDIGGSIVGRIVRGFFLFFLSGFSGVVIGSFCTNYRRVEDFFEPENAIPDLDAGFIGSLFWWPIFVSFQLGPGLLITFPFFCYAFVRSLFSELVPLFALLMVSLICATVEIVDDGNWLSGCVFAAVLFGYGYLGWLIASRDHPEKIETLIGFFNRSDDENHPKQRAATPPKRVGLKAWGEKVELEDDEWENK